MPAVTGPYRPLLWSSLRRVTTCGTPTVIWLGGLRKAWLVILMAVVARQSTSIWLEAEAPSWSMTCSSFTTTSLST